MKVFTLTLSPAYDVHIDAPGFACGIENHAKITSYEAGGKGLNVCRALLSGGIDNIPIILAGKENDGIYRKALSELGCKYVVIPTEGRIRENMTVHDENGKETRICFSALPVEESVIDEVAELIQPDEDTIVTITGRVPDGVGKAKLFAFVRRLTDSGAKVVIDSKSFTLNDLVELKPWLIKPNQEEISAELGCKIETVQDLEKHVKMLEATGIENIIVSLGGEGAVLIRKGELWTAVPKRITPVSTIGAGDSMVAGFICGYARGNDAEGQLRMAVAFGTSACLTEGTMPPERETIETVYKEIKISKRP